MTEDEIRLAAVELVLVEIIPWIDPAAVTDAVAAIKAGLDADIAQDEREIRMQALQLLTDGRQRYAGPNLGAWIRNGD